MNKSVLDFLTVAAQFCSFIESIETSSKKEFIDKSQKILSLLYLKGLLIPHIEDTEGFCEQFVTETDWEFIQQQVAKKLGIHESFVEIIEPDNYVNSETTSLSISECFADIYQDIRDFVERYKVGNEETQEAAIFECALHFKLYWGPKTLAILSEFHNLLFAAESSIDKEEDIE